MSLKVVHEAPPAPAPLVLVPRDRLIRLPEVENLTGCRKSSLYQMMKDGKFVPSIRYSARLVVWSERAVLKWVQDQINQAASNVKGA